MPTGSKAALSCFFAVRGGRLRHRGASADYVTFGAMQQGVTEEG
jgi:hypothetical protein